MSRSLAAAVPLLFAVPLFAVATFGCTKPKPPEPPPAVLRLLSDAVQRRAALTSLLSKAHEWKENAGKFDKLLELEGANRRTPPEPLDPAVFELQLRDAAKRVKLEVKSLNVDPPAAPRVFPDEAPADARFDLRPDDVFSTWKVTLAVTPDDAKKHEALRILLRAGDRLWRVTASRVEEKARVFELQTFGQRPVTMPRYQQNTDDLAAALKAAKAPTIEELLAGPHSGVAKDLQLEFQRITDGRATLEPQLADLAQQHLREVRYAAYRKLLHEWEAEAPLFKGP